MILPGQAGTFPDMKVGLAGFSRSGKTTIFNTLTGRDAAVGSFETKHKAAIAVVKVPDPRVDALAEIVKPERKKYAEVTFLDFPPSEERQSALDPRTLSQMREVEALTQVVRGFDDPLAGVVGDAVRDLRAFQSELLLADMTVIEKRLERLRKERGSERERALLERCLAALNAERPLRRESFLSEEETQLSGFAFLSKKPLLIVYNREEGEPRSGLPKPVSDYIDEQGLTAVPICGRIEMEIAELAEDERGLFLADLGVEDSARDRFIRSAYGMLNLISFFTAGPMEARAWTIPRGLDAVRAAGKIHSDIERGFIRAEVIAYDAYIAHRGELGCREAGKLRLEGKHYIIQDGDVVHFRFKV